MPSNAINVNGRDHLTGTIEQVSVAAGGRLAGIISNVYEAGF